MLEATLKLQPDDVESLSPLGMVKSDPGELKDLPANTQWQVDVGGVLLHIGHH